MNAPDPATIALIAQLTALKSALILNIASGVTSVSYDGRRVEYRDVTEMKRALNFTTAQLDALKSPNSRKPTAGVIRITRPYRPEHNRFDRF